MPETSKRLAGPPLNSGVRELVAGKRKWSSPPCRENVNQGFRGWHERGYLPHRDEPGLTQFVTFHLSDSFPAALRSEWKALLQVENDRERRRQLEQYLDHGRGKCQLSQPDIAGLVEETLRFRHPDWYELRAWVIMPNHVHFLIKTGNIPLSKIVKELKRFTAREVNRRQQHKGGFWCEDYFDTYIRNEEHELTTRRYIENNPVKALLVREPQAWPWSSARLRNQFGELQL